jgi:hypothetical protein
MLCLGMHYNVMLRFIVQAFQDPPLCSSTNIYCRSFAQFCLETEIAQARGTDHLKHLFIFFSFKVSMEYYQYFLSSCKLVYGKPVAGP